MADIVERCRWDMRYTRGHVPVTLDDAAKEIERLRLAVSKGEFLAQAAGRAMRDHGGAEKFLDLNAAVAEFRAASGTGPQAGPGLDNL